MTWVRIFDDSFQRVPVRNYSAMYADGYRVMAGYVAGGTSGKWVTAAEIKAWLSQGRDTGFLSLFEAVGDEPVRSPNSGTAHARAARAGARARGVPDTSAISPAMDRDVSKAQAESGGPIATYMRLWKAADTMRPFPYIEMDAGGELFDAGLTVGTGTPAAYGWDSTFGKLVTPDNAEAQVLWTQEHNGVNVHGGNIDEGHIRTDAPIHWANPNRNATEEDMPLTAADIAAIWTYKPDPTWPGLLDETPLGMLSDAAKRTGAIANTQLPAVGAALAGLTASAIAAAIQKLWPSGPPAGESAQQIADALHAELVADAQKTAAALAAK